MALLSIAVPFSCTPLLRRVAATGRTTITLRTGLRIRRSTDSLVGCRRCDNQKLVSSPRVCSHGVFGGALHLGADLRLVRAKSSVYGQKVVAAGDESPGSNPKFGSLILYSKPGCCLCDGLKEKLEGSGILSEIHLDVRDITTNSRWWNLYQYEIPVLARVRGDGIEELFPRLSPRLSAEQVQMKILVLMRSDA